MVSTPDTWNEKSEKTALHAVLSTRWSAEQCATVDEFQRAEILAAAGALDGRRVLDLGCGIGRLTGALARTSALVVGVDYSPGMLSRAANEVRSSNAVFLESSATRLPFPGSSFDVVVASFVFQHIMNDDEFGSACAEVVRLLRPRGVMVCMDGVADEHFRPSASRYTVVRTLDAYRGALCPSMRLESVKELRCIDDDYSLMRWIRS